MKGKNVQHAIVRFQRVVKHIGQRTNGVTSMHCSLIEALAESRSSSVLNVVLRIYHGSKTGGRSSSVEVAMSWEVRVGASGELLFLVSHEVYWRNSKRIDRVRTSWSVKLTILEHSGLDCHRCIHAEVRTGFFIRKQYCSLLHINRAIGASKMRGFTLILSAMLTTQTSFMAATAIRGVAERVINGAERVHFQPVSRIYLEREYRTDQGVADKGRPGELQQVRRNAQNDKRWTSRKILQQSDPERQTYSSSSGQLSDNGHGESPTTILEPNLGAENREERHVSDYEAIANKLGISEALFQVYSPTKTVATYREDNENIEEVSEEAFSRVGDCKLGDVKHDREHPKAISAAKEARADTGCADSPPISEYKSFDGPDLFGTRL
ncbi:hypothetical protein U1Q18_052127 [Sarracenia purpurea var. burkii]